MTLSRTLSISLALTLIVSANSLVVPIEEASFALVTWSVLSFVLA